jgi:CheY-like chemotaxis protein
MSRRVLIVEDDDVLRDLYSLRLGMEGFAVETACDGLEGLERVQAEMPDLIILDMLMPRLDGMGFLNQFRKLAQPPPPKVIVASNKSSSQSAHEAKTLGAVEYLIKSQITPDDLVGYVKRHILN